MSLPTAFSLPLRTPQGRRGRDGVHFVSYRCGGLEELEEPLASKSTRAGLVRLSPNPGLEPLGKPPLL